MKLKITFFTFLFILCGSTVFAQGQYILKCKVLDGKKEPLPGVAILETGTHNGTLTDLDGNFVIRVASEKSILKISYIGFETIYIQANKPGSILVMLEEASDLQEVVVVGYGSMRKKDVTGAVSSVTHENLNKGATTSPLQQLAGKAAGVAINQTGSEPGSSPSIRIRGITSLIGGSDPLVVIDGIQGNVDLLNQLPPNEIESIDILKDASATAIYGSRGAAGVVLVTTKKSQAGTSQIEYSGNVSFDGVGKKLQMLNANEWRTQAVLWNVPTTEDKGGNTDWFNALTRPGLTQNHSIAMGGGTNSFNYRASVTAILQDGIVINSNNQNYIGRFQATQKAFDDKLTVTANLSGSTRKNTGSPSSIGRADFTSNLISNAYVSRPTDPIYNPDGTYFTDPNIFQYINPYAVAQTVVNDQTVNTTFGSLKADLKIMKELTASWFGSWRKLDGNSGYYLPPVSTVTYAIDHKGVANVNNWHEDEKLTDVSLNYKQTFGNHAIDAIAVYEWQKQTYNGNFSQMKGFLNDITSYNALQLGDYGQMTPGDVTSYKNDRTLVSFLGRVNYSFMNRYLLTLSIRQDASSVFGVNYKWGSFPSASVAWRIREESFMKNLEFLNDLKIRAGYGVTGNQQGLSPQESDRLVNSTGQTFFAGNQITNYSIMQNGNPDLRWETRTQENIGVDFVFLNSRISGSVDVFSSTTKNLLFKYTVPKPPYPYDQLTANVGSMLNQGIEITLNTHIIKTKNLNFLLNGNLSFLKNKVVDLGGTINGIYVTTDYVPWGYSSYLVKGMPIGSYYVFKHLGKDDASKETVVNLAGNATIDTGDQSKDRYYAGSAIPTYTFGLSPVLTYKNFDVSMLFRGSGGNKIYNKIRSDFSFFESLGKSNVLKSALSTGLFSSDYRYSSDLWLEDGSFIRFENLTIGYKFDTKQLKKISTLHISLTATNLALFTKYSGLDPELSGNGANGSGIDGGIYPRTSTIALGLNVVFK